MMIKSVFLTIIKFHTTKQINLSLPMSVSGQDLVQLIENARCYPQGSPKRQRALHKLLLVVQKFPEFKKSTHPSYLDALNRTWEYLMKNLDKFEYDPNLPNSLVQKRLTKWLNSYLGWRIKDLYISDDKYEYDSLDKSIGDNEDNRTLGDTISDARNNRTLDGMLIFIKNEQLKETRRIGLKVELYIENDPDEKLKKCHPKENPECNVKVLARKIFLEEPPNKLKPISREMDIQYQTLVSFWKRKGLPLLREIVIELGYQTQQVS